MSPDAYPADDGSGCGRASTGAGHVEAREGRSRGGAVPLPLHRVDQVEHGRYIATTMPPITTPITTIMIGSSTEVSALTAASTSSS